MSAGLDAALPNGRSDRSGAAPGARYAAPADSRLLGLADQCVQCGLCLPHCPTYRLERQEAESPRGRIALVKALTLGRIEPTPTALAHLDHCLTCLSCEKVCPSEVRYEELITRSRAGLADRRPRPGLLERLVRNSTAMVALARIGVLLRARSWLPLLARRLPRNSRWRSLAEEVPDLPVGRPAQRGSSPRTMERGRVVLFRGCVASVYDRDTHAAARSLLEALGYEVVIPQGTPCCGALARHAGNVERAERQARETREAIGTGSATVLVSATGCFGDLRDRVLHGTDARAEDIHAFLARDARIAQLRFRPLEARAALHLPCTQVNAVGDVGSIRALLARIPALTVLDLPEQPRCCGAAGSYFIEHPGIANALRTEKLDQVRTQQPDFLLTTNIGCRIHLGNGLRAGDTPIPVRHPLALLAQQLENARP